MEMHDPASPFDVRMLWGLDAPSFELAERTYRGWMNGALRLQNEAMDFWRTAAGKNWAAASDMATCATAAEMFEAQTRYAQQSFADLMVEGRKLAEMFGEIVQENVSMLGATPEPQSKGATR
jgi:hypothetical protein